MGRDKVGFLVFFLSFFPFFFFFLNAICRSQLDKIVQGERFDRLIAYAHVNTSELTQSSVG
jgi:hypothetical protein